jgi:hypothetical protein
LAKTDDQKSAARGIRRWSSGVEFPMDDIGSQWLLHLQTEIHIPKSESDSAPYSAQLIPLVPPSQRLVERDFLFPAQ